MIKIHQQLPKEWDEREKLRNKGQFWTPSWVAEAMVAYVIENTELIFDPAAGKGAFCDALRKIDRVKDFNRLKKVVTFTGVPWIFR